MLGRKRSGLPLLLLVFFTICGLCARLLLGSWEHWLVYGQLGLAAALALLALLFGVLSGGFSHVQSGSSRVVLLRVINIVLVAILLVALNAAARRIDVSWDFSQEKVNSLTDDSKEVVALLKKTLRITVLQPPRNSDRREIRKLLALYESQAGAAIEVSFVDPQRNPFAVKRLRARQGDRLVLQYGQGKNERKALVGVASEEQLTNAIWRIVAGKRGVVYCLAGHGESSLNSSAPDGLRKFSEELNAEGLVVKELIISAVKEIPEDASLVVFAAPKEELSADDRSKILRYWGKGGRLLLLHDPNTSDEIQKISSKFGIVVGSDVIIDPGQRFQGADLWQINAAAYEYHPITEKLQESDLTVFLVASSVSAPKELLAAGRAVELVKSSSSSWGETDLTMLFGEKPRASRDKSERLGPIPLAVALESEANQANGNNGQHGRLVVFGDSEWLRNAGFDAYANRKLAIEVINWLIEDDQGVKLPPRKLSQMLRPITVSDINKLRERSLLVLEFLVLLAGIVWWRRKTLYG